MANRHPTIERIDKKLCSGCLPAIVSREDGSSIGSNCHGNPFIRLLDARAKEQKIICPCSDCLVKRMCQNICLPYKFYMDIAKGEMSYRKYKEVINELKGSKN